jgi:hypothetical protein
MGSSKSRDLPNKWHHVKSFQVKGEVRARCVQVLAPKGLANSASDVETVDLDDEEWTSDINVVASTIKMWLRELPEPLLTYALYQGFVDAASKTFCRMNCTGLSLRCRNRE